MSMSLALLAAVLAIPVVAVLWAGGPNVRFSLAITTAVTWGAAAVARQWFMLDRALFYWFIVHVVCAGMAGMLAPFLLGAPRARGLSIGAALVGSAIGALLSWQLSPLDFWRGAIEVAAPAVFASALSIGAANLAGRRVV